MKGQFYKLTLVTNCGNRPLDEYIEFIRTCAIAGITSVQLREKNTPYHTLLRLGEKIKKVLSDHHIPLIINDDVKLAMDLDADGVHLGQCDGDPRVARDLFGPDKIIGVSIEALEHLHEANKLPIDYVGISGIFPSQNKNNLATFWGIDGLRTVSSLSKHPIIAIGGINEADADDVMLAGSHGLAVIGAIHDSLEPASSVKNLRSIIDRRSVEYD